MYILKFCVKHAISNLKTHDYLAFLYGSLKFRACCNAEALNEIHYSAKYQLQTFELVVVNSYVECLLNVWRILNNY